MDYYKVLGINPGASKDEIKSAYRKLAKKYHPDVNKDKDSEVKFKEISEAYEALTNPKPKNFGFNPSYFDEMFNSMFHQNTSHNAIYKNLNISLEEAFSGCKKDVTVNKKIVCSFCNGNGFLSQKMCHACSGTGRKTFKQDPFYLTSVCNVCAGTGTIPDDMCNDCNGTGSTGTEDVEVEINVPPGIESGMTLRVNGQNLLISIQIDPDDNYRRDGRDLIKQVQIHYHQLVLGDEIEIETLDHKTISFKLPKGTKPNRRFVLKKLGMPDYRDQRIRGNIIIELDMIMPDLKDKKHIDLVEKLRDLEKKIEKK